MLWRYLGPSFEKGLGAFGGHAGSHRVVIGELSRGLNDDLPNIGLTTELCVYT